ncbi:DUF4129 domain-containing protein [Microbacterium oryzae]|uniref:DUF4129 domain-containing protein n=1 Tax=Microbacterium oryzae TaxID=743009 RepID=UPI0025B219BC|nr:DUF4129 domain-containing protein [Microbacterium oryzae]MDN3309901.1 DUF4129 domain-containing protein [Microbacterium oryzae]
MIVAVTAALASLPDGDEARDWAEEELSDPVYRVAEPTLFDRIAGVIGDVIARILEPQAGSEWSPLLAIIVTAVVAALVVCAFFIWGRPRSAHRIAERSAPLFGESDARSAAALRASAARLAAAGDWGAAAIDRFRALARSLDERGLVALSPGTTARGVATMAARPFPAHADELAAAADAFDDVRYLHRAASSAAYERMARLDDALAAARPLAVPVAAGAER